MQQPKVDWPKAVKPLLKKYEKEPHPLHAANLYQMLVMVVLSAQTNDNIVNSVAPGLLDAYPDMKELSLAKPEDLYQYISKIRNYRHKASWLTQIGGQIKKDSDIPLTMDALVELPGIGRKSANVIKRYAGSNAEGVMVDLHTVRVSNRLGIVATEDPKKIEQQMMEVLPEKEWDAGMAMSFLGRDICRPKPECPKCLMKKVCVFYQNGNYDALQATLKA